MAVLMEPRQTYCVVRFTRKGQAGGFPAALPPPIRTLRCAVLAPASRAMRMSLHRNFVVEIRGRKATDFEYIPVSVLRAPCTPTPRYGLSRLHGIFG